MLQAEERASAKKSSLPMGLLPPPPPTTNQKGRYCEIVLLFSLPLLQVITGHYLVIITYFHEVIRF